MAVGAMSTCGLVAGCPMLVERHQNVRQGTCKIYFPNCTFFKKHAINKTKYIKSCNELLSFFMCIAMYDYCSDIYAICMIQLVVYYCKRA